jgi:hypothetical protein
MMIRYYFQVGIGEKVHTFVGVKFPKDPYLFIKENKNILLGEEVYPLRMEVNEVVNIEGDSYVHVSSRRYYEKKGKGVLRCNLELSFVQNMLQKKKDEKNVK